MEKPTRVQDSDSTSLGFPRVPTGPLPAQGPVQGTTSCLLRPRIWDSPQCSFLVPVTLSRVLVRAFAERPLGWACLPYAQAQTEAVAWREHHRRDASLSPHPVRRCRLSAQLRRAMRPRSRRVTAAAPSTHRSQASPLRLSLAGGESPSPAPCSCPPGRQSVGSVSTRMHP